MSQRTGSAAATKRIQRELKEIRESPSRLWTAAPVGDDLFEWQFVVRGPPATDFEGGIYTGRIVLPVNYPLAPPSMTLLTPKGHWEVGKRICLNSTNYHPDLWHPAWGIRTMVEALIAARAATEDSCEADGGDDAALGSVNSLLPQKRKRCQELPLESAEEADDIVHATPASAVATVAMAAPSDGGPVQPYVFWGYAGWSRCQFTGEIARGSWGLCMAPHDLI